MVKIYNKILINNIFKDIKYTIYYILRFSSHLSIIHHYKFHIKKKIVRAKVVVILNSNFNFILNFNYLIIFKINKKLK
jgi:hypothetical protein